MSKFFVGEVCEARVGPKNRQELGCGEWIEVTLLSYSNNMWETDIPIKHFVLKHKWAQEQNLRKKRPPADCIPESVRNIFKNEVTA